MTIQRYDSGLLSSNMYVITENGHAVVIDPAMNITPGRELSVDFLIVTHEHYDHISGVNIWKETYNAPLLCSAKCADRIIDSKMNQARHFNTLCEIQSRMQIDALPLIDEEYTCTADYQFCDKMEFHWQGHLFRLMEIPGHSPGSIGIYLDEENFFSGDSLLEDTEIELRFPGGSKKEWKDIGEPRISAVPKGTIIRPGHFKSFVL